MRNSGGCELAIRKCVEQGEKRKLGRAEKRPRVGVRDAREQAGRGDRETGRGLREGEKRNKSREGKPVPLSTILRAP